MPEDADWKNIQACLYNDIFLEIQIPKKIQHGSDHAQGKDMAWYLILWTNIVNLKLLEWVCDHLVASSMQNWSQTFNKFIIL